MRAGSSLLLSIRVNFGPINFEQNGNVQLTRPEPFPKLEIAGE